MIRKSVFFLASLVWMGCAQAALVIECQSRHDHPEVRQYIGLTWDDVTLALYRHPKKIGKPAEADLILHPQRTASRQEVTAHNKIAKRYLFADDKKEQWFTIHMLPDQRDQWTLTYYIAWIENGQNGQFIGSSQTYSYRDCTLQEASP